MDIGYFYHPVYLIVVTILTFVTMIDYRSARFSSRHRVRLGKEGSALMLTVISVLFIGFRPISKCFGDMGAYAMAMVDHRFEDVPVSWDNNFLFTPMMASLSSIGADQWVPIVILAVINFGCTFIAMRKLFPKNVFLAMLVFFGAFSTFGAATNGLKAGSAAALFLVALAYREKIYISILFLILSAGFHHSMQLPIAAYLVCTFYKKTRGLMFFWILCFLLSMAHVTFFMGSLANYTDAHGADYLLTQAGSVESEFTGRLGFRYDFVIYSVIPIILGYYAIIKRKLINREYQFILNVYILTNAIWMLCMYANYTNRIAYLSWLMYPVLIIYPFMNMERGGKANMHLIYTVYGHLGFTLLMALIYY